MKSKNGLIGVLFIEGFFLLVGLFSLDSTPIKRNKKSSSKNVMDLMYVNHKYIRKTALKSINNVRNTPKNLLNCRYQKERTY